MARWAQATAVAMLLAMLTTTIRSAGHELGSRGVWLPIGLWGCIGIPAALDRSALPPTDRQVAVTPSTPNGHMPDTAVVLCGLAALGYEGIAQAIRQVREQTGLAPHELAMRLGLPTDALVLWEQGSFIPRTHHLLRLGQVLVDHQHAATPNPRRAADPSRSPTADACSPPRHARRSTEETEGTITDPDQRPAPSPVELNTSVPHPARVYDYWLGGKDNYPADRRAAEAVLAANPAVRLTVLENRAFLRRVVRFLAEQGIRQFLDIGTGIPTSPNVHEVAHAVAPAARVVYVDNDPIVLVHARALMAGMGTGRGTTTVIQADLRQPEAILDHPEVRRFLDFTQPLGLLLVAILHHLADDDDPAGAVARLREAIAPSSYVAISHGTADINPQAATRAAQRFAAAGPAAPYVARSRAAIERFFDGLEVLDPGVVQPPLWRPDGPVTVDLDRVSFYAGVGRKP